MAPSWMQRFLNPRRNWLVAQHYKALSKRLRNYGAGYLATKGFSAQLDLIPGFISRADDDLYDPMYDLDIKEALARLPREVMDARNQRLKRAMDLSMKHEYLQALQTPFRSYLQDMLALVKKERAEREALGALPLYQRTIP